MLVQDSFAQEIKIIEIQGVVLVRSREISSWRKASLGEVLSKDYEVLTKRRSKCTISLDQKIDNVITVEEHSHIVIADMLGRTIELSKGRVFSLIGNAKKTESFQIKTPTAVAGARGTGWMVGFITSTLAKCFQGTIYVAGLDEQGNRMPEQDIGQGSGIEVLIGGVFGDLFDLDNEDRETWNDFRGSLVDLKGSGEGTLEQQSSSPPSPPAFSPAEQDSRDEQKEDFMEEVIKEQRIEAEAVVDEPEDSGPGDN